MPALPNSAIAFLLIFAPLFSVPVWEHVQVLITGAILCQGPRTVTAILRMMWLDQETSFCKYHRVLSRAKWSGLQGAKILLGLLVALFLIAGLPIIIGVDETIERRKGVTIKAKGKYRDAVRSTQSTVVKCWGLKWICFMVLVPVPWSKRPWALPFLTLLAPSEQANQKIGKSHKTTVDWTILAVRLISRWLKLATWTLVGDGAYACVELAHVCITHKVTLVSRLRLDSRLFDFSGPQAESKRGRKPTKGKRLASLFSLAENPHQPWKIQEITWYGGETKRIKLLTGVCLWHTNGQQPVEIRWVLVIDPEGKSRTEAFFSTDTTLSAERIVEIFVMRWNIEVTFEEVRRHLGVETQRQWSDLAIARTTPMLMALFSLVCLIAMQLLQGKIMPLHQTSWYTKQNAAFSDVLAYVRRAIWSQKYLNNSENDAEYCKLPRDELEALLNRLAAAA
jgi:hypothetical protein